jgi:UDP-N-acetylglucosamine 2-epimerase (non-hydrolysing)
MIDSLRLHVEQALRSDVRQRLGIEGRPFGLVTLHRPANVDNEEQLTGIVDALNEISNQLPLFWPVHPRTRARLSGGKFRFGERIQLIDPLGYLDFLCLQAGSAAVFTDSGGIQEETTVLGVPCLTLRDNTERPVTIECGTNRLAGTRKETILAAWRDTQADGKKGQIPPLWDGQAGTRCRAVLRQWLLSCPRC